MLFCKSIIAMTKIKNASYQTGFAQASASVRKALLLLALPLAMAVSAQGAVIFSSSGGFLTSVQFTNDIVLNVSSGVSIVDNNLGYNVVFDNVYSVGQSSSSSTGSGDVLDIAGVTKNSVSSGVGLTADAITTTDLYLTYGGNGSGNTSIATGQQFTIKAGTFAFNSATIPTPTNLGSSVSLFITPNGGGFGGGGGFSQISDSTVVAVPEPTAVGLALLGLAALGVASRFRLAK